MICTKCKKEINPTAGYYNAPSGTFCIKCWEAKSDNFKNNEVKKALTNQASIAAAFLSKK